jgi:type IV pilus biogenesis protein PilP
LAETEERSRLSGLSRNELAGFRPIPRPAAAVAQPEPEIVPGEPTERAVAVSIVPLARPSGLAEAVREAAVQAVRPPPPPSGASVAQAATIRNGLRLNQVNLVGVYGSSSSRRALVRMPGGRFVMVTVGDRLDGGRVAAISANSLVYTKSGRNVTLEVPNG